MEVHDKIKFLRIFKGWSQEELAEKLDMTLNGYAKIENGKVDISLSKLKQLSEIFGVQLSEMIGLSDKNILYFIENHGNSNCGSGVVHHQQNCANTSEHLECIHKLEKAHLIIEKLEQEIYYLKQMLESIKQQK